MSRDSMWKMVILCVVSAMTSSEECVVEEKVGVTVDEVTSPAKVIREMEGSAESAQDCFQLCCRVANSGKGLCKQLIVRLNINIL